MREFPRSLLPRVGNVSLLKSADGQTETTFYLGTWCRLVRECVQRVSYFYVCFFSPRLAGQHCAPTVRLPLEVKFGDDPAEIMDR